MYKMISKFLIMGSALLAACSNFTSNDVLPTVAHLPEVRITPTNISTAILPLFLPTVAKPTVDLTMLPSPTSDISFANKNSTFVNVTATPSSLFDAKPSIFPTLVIGDVVTLEGQMTITDSTHAILTDSIGNTATILVDSFAAQMGKGQLVQVRGKIESQAGKLVIHLSEMNVLAPAHSPPSTAVTFPTSPVSNP